MQRLDSVLVVLCMTVGASTWGCVAGTAGNDGFSEGVGGAGGTSESGGSSSDGGSTSAFMGVGGAGDFICDSLPDEDKDLDGISRAQGDCNDCDPNVNPGAIEVIGEANESGGGGAGGGSGEYVPADEDCDDLVDNVAPPCDDSLAMEGLDPRDGARAIGLCKEATPDGQEWGVVNAAWVRANGTTPATANLHVGILDTFGLNVPPREGGRMLAISSGTARDGSDVGYVSHSYYGNGAGTPPAGFPQQVAGCSGGTNINDDVALDLTLRAPTNATGYKFDFKFYSNEFPEFVCTTYNDQFIALVNPAPMGSVNGNVSFDSQNNPVSVNIAFFDVCEVNQYYPQNLCPSGTSELQGTGFANTEGGTSWLQTTAPITGGETFSLRFAIWDTGDTAYDSTTLIDSFEWIANGGTVTVGTTPVPE